MDEGLVSNRTTCSCCSCNSAASSTVTILSEEGDLTAVPGACYWLVDPLDGTRGFLRGEEEFSINLGLVEGNSATLGVIVIPATGVAYVGGKNIPPFVRRHGVDSPIRTRQQPPEGPTVVTSTAPSGPHMQACLSRLRPACVRGLSSALKFCLVAEGAADIYPRFGRTMEWDTAAGQAILEAAGGQVISPEGVRLHYGKPGYENSAFIASGTTVST